MAHLPANQRYIRDYLRELFRKAWKEAHELKLHWWWALLSVALSSFVGVEKASLTSGLEALVVIPVLLFAWHMLVRTAALMHSASLPPVEELVRPGWRKVVVCLVDVSGINPFFVGPRDDELHWILLDLDKALKDAVRTTIESVSVDSLQQAVVASAQGILIKPIGGRAMLVWEYPIDDRLPVRVQTELALLIIDFLGRLQHEFYSTLDALVKRRAVRNDPLEGLCLRIALSSGNAWRRVSAFGNSLVDYVGLPVNEAAQLLQQALPSGGFVANLHLEPYLFMERYCANEGRIGHRLLAGTKNVISFWAVDGRQIISQRSVKEDLLDSLGKACDWLQRPYQLVASAKVPLGENDAMFVFELRETWEPRFARDLAERVHEQQVTDVDLSSIVLTVTEMNSMQKSGRPVIDNPRWGELGLSFHSQIAVLSNLNDARKRKMFTEEAYRLTWPVYSYATSDPSIVVKQHEDIIMAIRAGDQGRASDLVESHLKAHYERAKHALLETK